MLVKDLAKALEGRSKRKDLKERTKIKR